jgi:hypothetical protein
MTVKACHGSHDVVYVFHCAPTDPLFEAGWTYGPRLGAHPGGHNRTALTTAAEQHLATSPVRLTLTSRLGHGNDGAWWPRTERIAPGSALAVPVLRRAAGLPVDPLHLGTQACRTADFVVQAARAQGVRAARHGVAVLPSQFRFEQRVMGIWSEIEFDGDGEVDVLSGWFQVIPFEYHATTNSRL